MLNLRVAVLAIVLAVVAGCGVSALDAESSVLRKAKLLSTSKIEKRLNMGNADRYVFTYLAPYIDFSPNEYVIRIKSIVCDVTSLDAPEPTDFCAFAVQNIKNGDLDSITQTVRKRLDFRGDETLYVTTTENRHLVFTGTRVLAMMKHISFIVVDNNMGKSPIQKERTGDRKIRLLFKHRFQISYSGSDPDSVHLRHDHGDFFKVSSMENQAQDWLE